MSLIGQEDCKSQWFWHQGDIKNLQLIIYLNQVFSFDYLSKLQVNHCSSLHCKQIPVHFCHVCPRSDVCAWLFPRQGLFALSRSGTLSELNSLDLIENSLNSSSYTFCQLSVLTLQCNHEGHSAADTLLLCEVIAWILVFLSSFSSSPSSGLILS